MIKKNQLDAFIGFINGIPSLIELFTGDSRNEFYFATQAAKAGFPQITVHNRRVYDLHLASFFFAGAVTYEQATKHRTVPKFINNINFYSGV